MDREGENTIGSASPGIKLPVRVRRVTVDRSGRWLTAAWRDLKRTPAVSLTDGDSFVVLTFVGLAVVLPLPGNVTWHAYSDLIEPEASGDGPKA